MSFYFVLSKISEMVDADNLLPLVGNDKRFATMIAIMVKDLEKLHQNFQIEFIQFYGKCLKHGGFYLNDEDSKYL